MLEEVTQKHNLFLPPHEEPSVHVYLMTIKDRKYDIEPEYVLDWRDHFVGSEVEVRSRCFFVESAAAT